MAGSETPEALIDFDYNEFTSYDIPLHPRLPEPVVRHDPSGTCFNGQQTTTFIEHGYQEQDDDTSVNDLVDFDQGQTVAGRDGGRSSVSHGFFFGTNSIDYSKLKEEKNDKNEEAETDSEDEGLGEIYRPHYKKCSAGGSADYSSDQIGDIRGSNRSFELSPESTPTRQVLSQRIGNVGIIGQNIALGHRLGLNTDDSTLIPKPARFDAKHIVVTEDCPTQIEIKWSKPANSSSFASVVYKIETSLPDSEGEQMWTELISSHQPVFRIYHTDDKMLVGKHHVTRRDESVIVKFRVRCHGEILLQNGQRHWTISSYSRILEVTFVGYRGEPTESLFTSL